MLNYLLNFSKIAKKKINDDHINIISNTSWLFFGKIFRLAISLFVGTWIARYLGPKDFGILQYALAFSSFFLPLSTAQMSPIITRDLVQKPASKNEILGTAFIIQITGGILAAILSIAAIILLSPEDSYIQLLVVIVSLKFIFNSLQPIENWFESQVNSKFQVLSSNIAFVFITLLKILLIVNQASLLAITCIIVLEAIIYSLGLIFYYQLDKQNIRKWHTNLPKIKYLLKESYPLLLSATAILFYSSIDRVMLGNMIGSSSVGIYSSAANLSGQLYFIPVIVCSSLFPTIVKSKNLSKSAYNKKLQKIYNLIGIISYSLIIVLIPLSGFLITLLYGNDYQAAIPIFSLHLFTCLFTFQGEVRSKWIVTQGLQKLNFYARLTGLVLNVLLNLLLIPVYQGMGAAIATLISAAVSNYLCFLVWQETRENAMLTAKALLLPFRRLPNLSSR
ncbi:MAG: flippase [Xenococcaceae cyanobacterium MO_188.B19]|nr:flippase [Xenococcaceae cyanobacterium MO_188.B19]